MTNLKEIKGMPESQRAREILGRLMKHTGPSIARHKWKLVELKEFYPSQEGLLGLNMNRAIICIRLRESYNKEVFKDWHDILGTMVHELTHMDISKHSAEFYSKMDELYAEIEGDESSGLINRFDGINTNAGIPSGPFHRLGEVDKKRKSKSREERSHQRAEAAEKRRQAQIIMGGGVIGQEGMSKRKPEFDLSTPAGRRRAMAWAATKRLQDNDSCPAESQLEYEEDNTRVPLLNGASPLSVTKPSFPSSSLNSSDTDNRPAKKKKASLGVIDLTGSPDSLKASVALPQGTRSDAPEDDGWSCPICTYIDPIDSDLCSMCSYRRKMPAGLPNQGGCDPDFDPFKSVISSGSGAWRGKRHRN